MYLKQRKRLQKRLQRWLPKKPRKKKPPDEHEAEQVRQPRGAPGRRGL
jgi:hypothetical protein